jgi:hypothetical protein
MRSIFFEALAGDGALGWPLSLSVAGLVVMWILIGIFLWQLPPEVPMWYSLPPGASQLSSREWFLLIPSLALAMTTVNMIVIRLGLGGVKIFGYMVAWLTALLVFLAGIAMVHIIMMAL